MQIAAADGDALAGRALPPLLDELWAGHERALRAIAIEDRDELCALKLEVGLKHFPNGEYETLVEKMLQAGAEAAEGMDELSESILAVLAKLETITAEEWDAMPAEQRARYEDPLRMMRENRDGVIATLPLEQLQEWERRFERASRRADPGISA